MTESATLTHRFVTHVPETLEEGVVYVSVAFATVVHACCCGCGNEVVTPLAPDQWKLLFDGETISLRPSIGNWGFPCQSHYWITRNTVEWADTWSHGRLVATRAGDVSQGEGDDRQHAGAAVFTPGIWQRLKRWLFRER
jgi:hypothetical protein